MVKLSPAFREHRRLIGNKDGREQNVVRIQNFKRNRLISELDSNLCQIQMIAVQPIGFPVAHNRLFRMHAH